MKITVELDTGETREFGGHGNLDALLLVREYGPQFNRGARTHVFGAGVWEHVTLTQMYDVIDRLTDL